MSLALAPALAPTPSSALPARSAGAAELRASLVALAPELRGKAVRLARDAARADDLVQDAMERALRFDHGFRAGTSPRAYLHQILFSVFVTQCRRGKREARVVESLRHDPNAWTAEGEARPLEALTPTLRSAVEALPEPYRGALVEVDLVGRSYEEAAARLRVPLGTVMSRLHRGRRLLRSALLAAPDAALFAPEASFEAA